MRRDYDLAGRRAKRGALTSEGYAAGGGGATASRSHFAIPSPTGHNLAAILVEPPPACRNRTASPRRREVSAITASIDTWMQSWLDIRESPIRVDPDQRDGSLRGAGRRCVGWRQL